MKPRVPLRLAAFVSWCLLLVSPTAGASPSSCQVPDGTKSLALDPEG